MRVGGCGGGGGGGILKVCESWFKTFARYLYFALLTPAAYVQPGILIFWFIHLSFSFLFSLSTQTAYSDVHNYKWQIRHFLVI